MPVFVLVLSLATVMELTVADTLPVFLADMVAVVKDKYKIKYDLPVE